QVETINAAFEQRLTEHIPGITAQEIRYCGLLRLGMDNQQIAKLLNKSYGTVRIYKHRISKKAGIDGKEALKKLVDSL
ncbi:MAG: LuxR C-terminal-related transcriptional regulator, partial [Bacteroidota bacterium]